MCVFSVWLCSWICSSQLIRKSCPYVVISSAHLVKAAQPVRLNMADQESVRPSWAQTFKVVSCSSADAYRAMFSSFQGRTVAWGHLGHGESISLHYCQRCIVARFFGALKRYLRDRIMSGFHCHHYPQGIFPQWYGAQQES